MLFSELYSAYYNAVAGILREACARPLPRAELRKIVEREAFGESLLNIEPAILSERWQLLNADGTTPIRFRVDADPASCPALLRGIAVTRVP